MAAVGLFVAHMALDWWTEASLLGSDESVSKAILFAGLATAILYVTIVFLARRLGRAEAALREQEEQWKLALKAVGDCVWESDFAGDDSLYSCDWAQMLGHEPGGVAQTVSGWRGLIHPDDAGRVDREFREFLSGAESHWRCEYRMRARDGSFRWVLSRGRLIRRAVERDSKRMIGTLTDITARKQTERTLEETARNFRMLFDANPNPVWIYDRETLAVLVVNEAAVSKYGYTREQFLRLTIRDLGNPEDVPELLAFLRSETVFTKNSGPWRHRKADGSALLVEITSREIDWEGRAARFVLANDVTGREKAAARLNLLHSALQATPVGWVVTDKAGLIERANPAFTRLTGYTLEEVAGKNPRVLNSGRHPPEFYAQMWQTIHSGISFGRGLEGRLAQPAQGRHAL